MREMIGAVLAVAILAGVVVAEDDKAEGKASGKPVATAITGQCHCGAVKYEASGPVVKSSYCDCRGCQRATGAIQAPFVTLLRAGFKVTQGKPTEFRAKSKAKCDCHGTWHFCPKCGTQLFWKGDKGKELDVFAGTLDDTSVFQPKK